MGGGKASGPYHEPDIETYVYAGGTGIVQRPNGIQKAQSDR